MLNQLGIILFPTNPKKMNVNLSFNKGKLYVYFLFCHIRKDVQIIPIFVKVKESSLSI